MNCGGNLNILEILEPEEDVMFYIADRYLKKGFSPMGYSGFQVKWMIDRIFWVWNFRFWDFFGGVGKFGKYVFGWLDLSGDFLGIQHNLRFVVVSAFLSCIHVFLRIKYNQTCFAFWKLFRIKMQYGFSVVNFWSRDFGGFCWNYGTLGIFAGFDFCPRPIIPVFWNPENSSLGSLPWHWD